MITTILEMCFSQQMLGANIDISALGEADTIKALFAENSGVIIQSDDAEIENILNANGVAFTVLGNAIRSAK